MSMPRAAISVATSTCKWPNLKSTHGLGPLVLRFVAMDGIGVDFVLVKHQRDLVRPMLRAGEHQNASDLAV
jgi:hypothetical protein